MHASAGGGAAGVQREDFGGAIAEMWQTDPSWVRKVIHEFNERGMSQLAPSLPGRASPPDHD